MEVLYAGDMKNPYALWNVPHVVASLRGDELWLITDGDFFSREKMAILRRLGFKKMPDFDSYYFSTKNLEIAINSAKKLEKDLGLKYLVCAWMKKELYVVIKKHLETGA